MAASMTASASSSAIAPIRPVSRCCTSGGAPLGRPANHVCVLLRVGGEAVDADDPPDAGQLDGVEVVNQVGEFLLHKADVFLRVLLLERAARNDGRTTSVHLEGVDGCGEDGYVGSEAAVAALHISEFL